MSMLKMKNSKQETLPVAPTLPARPLSLRAAEVSDHIEQLETELAQAHDYGQQEHNARLVAEKLIEELRAEYHHRSAQDAQEIAHERDRAERLQRDVYVLVSRNDAYQRSVLNLAEALRHETPPQLAEAPPIEDMIKDAVTTESL